MYCGELVNLKTEAIKLSADKIAALRAEGRYRDINKYINYIRQACDEIAHAVIDEEVAPWKD